MVPAVQHLTRKGSHPPQGGKEKGEQTGRRRRGEASARNNRKPQQYCPVAASYHRREGTGASNGDLNSRSHKLGLNWGLNNAGGQSSPVLQDKTAE